MPKRTEHPATQDSTVEQLLAEAAADYAAAAPRRDAAFHGAVAEAREDARIDAAETARANRRS